MFQPFYTKPVYLKRAVYSGALLVAVFVGLLLPDSGVRALLLLGGGILLAFLCMKTLADLATKLTGLTFFASAWGLLILFAACLLLGVFIGPLYFVFNLVQYARASDAPAGP